MKLKQLSVFLENSPGHLQRICSVLSKANINLQTITISESKSYGLMRAIVDKPEEAVAALEKEGIMSKLIDVLSVEVPDRPGALLEILNRAQEASLNIEYMYAWTKGERGNPIMIMKFNDVEQAAKILDS